MIRRRFLFWVGLGFFSLSEKLRVDGLDRLAAATMRGAGRIRSASAPGSPTHWRAAENASWRWFERESMIDGEWTMSGITIPVHKRTGEPLAEKAGYLDDSLVPAEVRASQPNSSGRLSDIPSTESHTHDADPARRTRHGRPPSRWLRSLHADELRIWLRTIDVPEALVSGMTYWEHLTRDHSFDANKIAGLSIDEQAKLHAAAHFGY